MPRPTSPFDHPQAKALLRGILDDPDDDAPRLVMADWLEEHGHEQRAEFIRVQIALVRTADGDPEGPRLQARVYELVAGLVQTWRKQEQQPSCQLRTVYHRGFIGEVRGTVARWMKSAGGLFRMAPIRLATVDFYGTRMKEFVASPPLARLSRLTLDAYAIHSYAADWLVQSTVLAGVPHLVIERRGGPTLMTSEVEQRLRAHFGARLRMQAANYPDEPYHPYEW